MYKHKDWAYIQIPQGAVVLLPSIAAPLKPISLQCVPGQGSRGSDRNCPGHDLTDGRVGLPEGHAAVVRHPPGQDTLFCQLLSFRVPAEHCRNDFVLLIPAAGDEQLVVARRDATAGSLVGELSHQAPGVLPGAVRVQSLHRPTWQGNGHWFALATPGRGFNSTIHFNKTLFLTFVRTVCAPKPRKNKVTGYFYCFESLIWRRLLIVHKAVEFRARTNCCDPSVWPQCT